MSLTSMGNERPKGSEAIRARDSIRLYRTPLGTSKLPLPFVGPRMQTPETMWSGILTQFCRYVSGGIPAELGELKQLLALTLGGNNLKGTDGRHEKRD